jgi:chromosome segregation ATPase
MVQQLWEKANKTGAQTTDQLKEELAKQLEEAQQMRSQCEQANGEIAKELYKVHQQREKLARQLENAQKMVKKMHQQWKQVHQAGNRLAKQFEEAKQLGRQEWVKLANAKETWKVGGDMGICHRLF